MNSNFIKLIPPATRKKVIAELTKQHKKEPVDYDLCYRIKGQYFDVMNQTDGWKLMVCGIDVDERYESRAEALKALKEILT